MENELLNRITSNPELLQNMIQVISNALRDNTDENMQTTSAFASNAMQPNESYASLHHRKNLLQELKPFLSDSACAKMDRAIQLCELACNIKATFSSTEDI